MQNLANNRKANLKQRCFLFSVATIHFIEKLSQTFVEQILAKQLLRSATSIGANIVEALGSSSKRDFAHFFSIALKSSKETQYWLYLFKTTHKGEQETLDVLLTECDQLSKMIAASILTMKGKR